MLPTVLDLAPYRVHPPVSGGPLLIDGANRGVAANGWRVNLFSVGVRRSLGFRGWLPSWHQPCEGVQVYHHVSPLAIWLNRRSSQASGMPPIGIDQALSRTAPRQLRSWLATADVVQVEGPFGYAFAAAHRPPYTPVVLICHNVESVLAKDQKMSPRVVGTIHDMEQHAVLEADAVVVLTEADRNTLLACYGANPDRIHIVPVGVGRDRFTPVDALSRRRIRERLALSGKTVAVFTGARYPSNIEALHQLERLAADPTLPPDMVFLVLGRVGELASGMQRVVAPGFVTDVVPYLQAADLAVNPMVSGGGMHLKILEFMAVGLPVLSTPFGLRGVVHPYPAGVWEHPLSAWPSVLENLPPAMERRSMGDANREWVGQRYGWDMIGKQRVRIYQSLVR